MSDECCCPDPKNPTPSTASRESTGGSTPSGQGLTSVLLMGARSIESNNEANAKPLATTPGGVLRISMDTVGETTTLVIDNLTLVFRNGTLQGHSFTGSGIASQG